MLGIGLDLGLRELFEEAMEEVGSIGPHLFGGLANEFLDEGVGPHEVPIVRDPECLDVVLNCLPLPGIVS